MLPVILSVFVKKNKSLNNPTYLQFKIVLNALIILKLLPSLRASKQEEGRLFLRKRKKFRKHSTMNSCGFKKTTETNNSFFRIF